MNTAEILKHVDHTLLKPIATWEDIQKICDESIEYNTASICIPSCYIPPGPSPGHRRDELPVPGWPDRSVPLRCSFRSAHR